MNNVSLSSMLRYMLQNKTKIIGLILLTTLLGVGLAQILYTPVTGESPTMDQSKVEINRNYRRVLENEFSAAEMYPQIIPEKLFLAQKKYIILPAEPERQMSYNYLFESLAVDGEALREAYNQAAGYDFSAQQVKRMGLFETAPEKFSMWLSANGPNQASADLLLDEMIRLMMAQLESLSIDVIVEEVHDQRGETSHLIFFDRAKTYVDNLNTKRSQNIYSIQAIPEATGRPDYVRFGVMGFLAGVVAAILLALFGSAGNTKYFNLSEQSRLGLPLIGAYRSASKPDWDGRLFAGKRLFDLHDLIDKTLFSLLPRLSQGSKLSVWHDETDTGAWQQAMADYGVAAEFIPLSDRPRIFQSLKQADPILVIVDQAGLSAIEQTLPKQLADQTAVVVHI